MEETAKEGKWPEGGMKACKREEVLVGILCYNHKPYIACCLESVFRQKCKFPFKLFVFDDASTDGSWDIILEYKRKFGDKMVISRPEENTFQKGHRNAFLKALMEINESKYIALCEADDYWTDEYKLQKQYEVMQKKDEAGICVHDVELFDVCNGKCMGVVPGRWNTGWTRQELITQTLTYRISFRLNSYFFDSTLLESVNLDSDFWNYWAQDLAIIIFYMLKRPIIYLNDNMAIKRINNEGSLSHKSNLETDVCQQQIGIFEADTKWIDAFDRLSEKEFYDLVEYYKLFRRIKIYYLKKGQLEFNKWVSNGNGRMYTKEICRKINRLYVKFVRLLCFNNECQFVKISRKWMEKEWKRKY